MTLRSFTLAFGVMAVFGLLMTPAVRAQSQSAPVEMPSPIPTPTPNTSPVPYPAYGSPAPDVEALTAHPGVPQTITLEQSEKIAVALSPVFLSQNAQWAAIHAKYTSEKQALYPAISGTGTMGTTYSNGTATTNASRTSTGQAGGLSPNAKVTPIPAGVLSRTSITSESVGITIAQLIYDGGRTIAAIHSAKSADMSGRATLLRQLETLQINVASAYYTVLSDNATVAADVQLVREFETNENSVRAQIRNGAAARSDLAGAQFQTAQARGQLVTAQGAAIGAQATFATTLGLDADALVVPSQIGKEGPATNPTYAQSLKRAMLLRPDYLAAAYNVTSAEENLRYAKLARFPVLSAGASDNVGRNFIDCSYASGPQNAHPEKTQCPGPNGYTNVKTLGLSLNVPIYDQGVTNYNVAVAASQVDQAKAGLQQTKLSVEADVRTALANLISARANLVQAISARDSAQVSLDATQAQYKVGAATILNLVTAEANLSTATATYISGLYGVKTAEQNYLYATGASDLQL
ncbi:MAG TPA: TolC family protein [Candidatus Baltobacteraceae bacterium]|nr:TolC family protein [Candidatus Baltobacteraceae bacterium]